MRIFFISIHVEKVPPAFPLAAAVLESVIMNDKSIESPEVSHLDFYKPADAQVIAEHLLSLKADFIGFSAYSWNSSDIIEITRRIRAKNSRIIIFAGGPQATAAPEDFRNTMLFDFIIRGEGESVIVKALKTPPQKGTVIDADEYSDFSGSRSPYKKFRNFSDYSGVLWELSRGCPYNCAFCYESRGSSIVRTITAERMTEELILFRKAGIDKIWVLDPTFNHNREHAGRVLDLIRKHHPDAHYTFEIRAELMTEDLCSKLSELNASLQIGLQTTNPAALKHINRNLNKKKFLDKCSLMSGYGLSYGIDIIYGLPGDSYEDFKDSIDFAVKAAPNNLDIFKLSVLPGTELSEKADELGIIHRGFPSYTVIENAEFSRDDMKKAEKLTEACDRLYNIEQSFTWLPAAAEALSLRLSELFEHYSTSRGRDIIAFISTEFSKRNKQHLFEVMESFIRWSRAAERALSSPGQTVEVRLCRKPEILDELTNCKLADFYKKHPSGRLKTYKIHFDGCELYIS